MYTRLFINYKSDFVHISKQSLYNPFFTTAKIKQSREMNS